MSCCTSRNLNIQVLTLSLVSVMLGGRRRYFMFRVLPFGLSTACYMFTNFLWPLVKYWRSSGLRIILYIYDGISIASSASECRDVCRRVLTDLENAGLMLNYSLTGNQFGLVLEQLGWLTLTLVTLVMVSHGMWSVTEARLSSTWRELKAVDMILRSFGPRLQGHKVKWFTDNQSVKFIV